MIVSNIFYLYFKSYVCVSYSSQMTAHDCFEIGRESFFYEDYYYSLMWMTEALNRLNNNTDEISKVDILEYIAFCKYKQGNVQITLSMQ